MKFIFIVYGCLFIGAIVHSSMGLAYPLSKDRFNGLDLKSELIYRQAALSRRKRSILYDETKYKDYVDQIYLSFTFVRTEKFVDKIVIEPSFFTRRLNPDQKEFDTDQAYIETSLNSRFKLIAGRKREFYGTGLFYTPSDLLNLDRDVFDEVENKRGKNLTRLEGKFGDFRIGLGYIPAVARSFHQGKGWLLGSWSGGQTSIDLQQTYDREYKTTTGLAVSTYLAESVELHVDGKLDWRQNLSADYPEAPFSSLDKEDKSYSLLFGSRYTLSSSFSIFSEYITRSMGLSKDETFAYYQAQRSLLESGQTINQPFDRLIGQSYLVVGFVEDKLAPSLRAKVSSVTNLADKSSFLGLNLTYLPASTIELSYSPVFYFGGAGTEFGENPLSAAHYLSLVGRI